MTQALSLFTTSDFEVRKPANQNEFEENNKEILCSFPGIVDKSFERLNREIYPIIEPESRDKNMPAIIISGFIRGEMKKKFPLYCGKATPQRFRLKFENSEWIYIKKLNSNKHKQPSNIKTIDNDKIMNQLSDSSSDVVANIFLGYTANHEMTQPDKIYAVYIVGEKVEWYSDLRDLASLEENRNYVKQLSSPKETDLREGIVRIRPKQANE